jgi:AdoMet-dependent heme synthase
VAYEGELTTAECKRVIDSLPPNLMIIWTGGEPMSRPDILELVRHATQRGIRSVMAPCGMLVTESALVALKEAGVMACSFSLDGATATTHDAFRGVEGTFAMVTQAMKIAQQVGMPFQVNCTVSQLNQHELPAIREQAIAHGAKTLDLFFLVPVGRGKSLQDRALSSADTERVLRWAFEMDAQGPIHVRETCAPQAIRIWSALGKARQSAGRLYGRQGFCLYLAYRRVATLWISRCEERRFA